MFVKNHLIDLAFLDKFQVSLSINGLAIYHPKFTLDALIISSSIGWYMF